MFALDKLPAWLCQLRHGVHALIKWPSFVNLLLMTEQELKAVIITGLLLAIWVKDGIQSQIEEVINHLRQHPFDVIIRYP